MESSGRNDSQATGKLVVAEPDLCAVCFEAVVAEIEKRDELSSADVCRRWSKSKVRLDDEFPLFVTWNTVDGPVHSDSAVLRGCIGTFRPVALSSGLSEYAKIAAFHDSRFRPIRARELSSLSCTVTLLTNFEKCDGIWNWTVGKHGIRIDFRTSSNERLEATFLPDVPTEQEWNQIDTLRHLVVKAGYTGRVGTGVDREDDDDDWIDRLERTGSVVRYLGTTVAVHYRDWKLWRDQLETA